MSEEKTSQEPAGDTENGNKADDPAIQEAMAEAIASMGAREQSEEIEVDLGGSDEAEAAPPKKDANAAVTEALIEAKRELETVLKQTQKETDAFREKWLRAAADLENYRKRAEKERLSVERFANEKLLKDLLPLLDDLDRALEMVGDQPPAEAEQIVDGMRLLHKKWLTQLEKHQVTTFEAVGEAFDPSVHEAVQQVHSDQPAGAVADQLQRGFMIHGRLLRPALVTVSLGPEGGSEEKEDAET